MRFAPSYQRFRCVSIIEAMRIRVLGAFGGERLGHRPSSFLINDKILLDGGSVTAP